MVEGSSPSSPAKLKGVYVTTLESVFIQIQNTLNYIHESKITVNLKKVMDDLEGTLNTMIDARNDLGPQSRRIVQLTASDGDDDHYDTLYALCDDNTIWRLGDTAKGWQQIEGIPMPKEEDAK